MNVLVVGSGGREHALAWKIAQSPRAARVFVAPGNAGTALEAENVDIPATDILRLLSFARQNKIEFTVIGPEAALAAGVVDAFHDAGLRAFGPTRAAAELETSKVFCKNLLRHADVPTADYRVFRDAKAAITFLKDRDDVPVVVKADGLAAGKGVFVCDNREQALEAIERIALKKEFGNAGNQLIIEETLHGQEASVLAFTDGHTLLTMPPCQDHKRAHDGDTGPNTGGMGAYCPTPLITDQLLQRVEEKILVPTVHQMKRSRRPFKGVLYAGLMVTAQGIEVLEYNVRFGDPECQPLLMRLKSDLLDLLEATADGRLDEVPPPIWDPRPAVCVVMASEGYPGSFERGQPIRGLDEAVKLPDLKVFHAGTKQREDQIVTDGGRVLGVTALGSSISAAKLQAYKGVKAIRFSGAWCRKDISDKGLSYK
jgi:phosphoribosylamine--glycine ligase